MKRLALFCDGTWSDLGARHPTNVARLARWVLPMGGGAPQIVGYESGVGVPTGVSALADGLVRLWGGALGRGLDAKIEAAYRFLCLNHAPGDEVFVFGFSRGAYTARSLCGLLRACGLLPREQLHRTSDALVAYRRGERWKTDSVAIRYLGLWDTVGSLGVPGGLTPRRYRFHDTEVSPLVRSLRHAVASMSGERCST